MTVESSRSIYWTAAICAVFIVAAFIALGKALGV